MAIVPVGTTFGTPLSSQRSDFSRGGDKVAAAPPGGMPFTPAHCTATTKAGHACQARCVKGTELCVGHTRSASAR